MKSTGLKKKISNDFEGRIRTGSIEKRNSGLLFGLQRSTKIINFRNGFTDMNPINSVIIYSP